MNYSKVQFIAWELNTGPKNAYRPDTFNLHDLAGYYPGICYQADQRFDVLGQCHDIEARVKFTEAAIKAAAQRSNIDKSASTLKVFLAPEFLFRGAGGAYLHDLLNGWVGAAPADFVLTSTPYASKWPGLFGSLQALVASDDYKDWVFVFGTAISASFATVLYPLPKTTSSKAYIDWRQAAEIYNTSLVQLGGKANTNINYASRKQYISGIDFLRYYPYSITAFLKHNVKPLDSNAVKYVVETAKEAGAVFTLNSVNGPDGKALNFGLEICLDHSASGGIDPATGYYRNNFGRLRNAGKSVKLQLVPSAGMSLVDASIRLETTPGKPSTSYAFNCDGLNNLTSDTGNNSHSQLWNGANGAPVPAANKLLEINGGVPCSGTQVAPVASSVTTTFGSVNDNQLWANGAGAVRVLNSLPL